MDELKQDEIINMVGEGELIYTPPNEIVAAEVTSDSLIVKTKDGRTITAPLSWFPFLMNATEQQRRNFRIMGHVLDWEELDDGVSMETFLLGLPEK
jgi:hypothetical protein